MLFSLLYFLVRRLLGAGGRPQDEKDIELLVLRHWVKVLKRQVKRLDYTALSLAFDCRGLDPPAHAAPAYGSSDHRRTTWR
jgi:hypothetical protein